MDSSTVQKIRRSSVTQQVFGDLKRRILVDGEFTAGDKLPSEHQLAQLYGVSRNSVRSALQRLSNMGIVEIRVGEGSFVRELSFSNLTDLGDVLAARDTIGADLHEFRTDMERSCVRLAVVRATPEQLARLRRCGELLCEAAARGDLDEFVQRDYDFHYQLSLCTNNKLYEMMYASIQSLFLKCIRENISTFIQETETGQLTSARNHMRLVDALERKDTKKAVGLLTLILAPSALKHPTEQS